MANKRKRIPIETKQQVLHEAGYRCSNPACRTILTLDVHHLDYVAEGGSNNPNNLLALCPNCHSLHHKGHIPSESIRAWKLLLLSLNEGFDRSSLDVLLALEKVDHLLVSGEGVLACASLIAADLVKIDTESHGGMFSDERYGERYWVEVTEKGRSVISAWKRGDQEGVVNPNKPSNNKIQPTSSVGS